LCFVVTQDIPSWPVVCLLSAFLLCVRMGGGSTPLVGLALCQRPVIKLRHTSSDPCTLLSSACLLCVFNFCCGFHFPTLVCPVQYLGSYLSVFPRERGIGTCIPRNVHRQLNRVFLRGRVARHSGSTWSVVCKEPVSTHTQLWVNSLSIAPTPSSEGVIDPKV